MCFFKLSMARKVSGVNSDYLYNHEHLSSKQQMLLTSLTLYLVKVYGISTFSHYHYLFRIQAAGDPGIVVFFHASLEEFVLFSVLHEKHLVLLMCLFHAHSVSYVIICSSRQCRWWKSWFAELQLCSKDLSEAVQSERNEYHLLTSMLQFFQVCSEQ